MIISMGTSVDNGAHIQQTTCMGISQEKGGIFYSSDVICPWEFFMHLSLSTDVPVLLLNHNNNRGHAVCFPSNHTHGQCAVCDEMREEGFKQDKCMQLKDKETVFSRLTPSPSHIYSNFRMLSRAPGYNHLLLPARDVAIFCHLLRPAHVIKPLVGPKEERPTTSSLL